VERCPHRDHGLILRYSHRVLSLFLSFRRSGFFPPSRVWVTSVRPAVVLFYDPTLLVLRLILFLRFMPDDGTPTSFIFQSPSTQSLWISSRLRFLIITTPSLCVRPLLLSLLSYVHITFLPSTPFVVCIFSTRLSFSVYIFPL
jgi:hypothetical protein